MTNVAKTFRFCERELNAFGSEMRAGTSEKKNRKSFSSCQDHDDVFHNDGSCVPQRWIMCSSELKASCLETGEKLAESSDSCGWDVLRHASPHGKAIIGVEM